MPLHVSSTVVLIIRRSKLYYAASGIITLKQVSGLKFDRNFRKAVEKIQVWVFRCFADCASQYNLSN